MGEAAAAGVEGVGMCALLSLLHLPPGMLCAEEFPQVKLKSHSLPRPAAPPPLLADTLGPEELKALMASAHRPNYTVQVWRW